MADIKNYKAKTNCFSSGQVLMRDYSFTEARIIIKEMLDLLCLDMVSKKIGYRFGLYLCGLFKYP